DLLIDGTGFLASGALTFTDLPLNGVLTVALGAWVLRFGDPATHDDGVLLLAVGERWAYNRSLPCLAWERLVALAERAAPGRIGELQKEYAGRPGPELISVAEKVLSRLTSSW
ncbi:MAG: hypothetical protein H0X12_04790, partial [Nocardioides sp.]|nr:hypothetical protein [Nocardioides sp.]